MAAQQQALNDVQEELDLQLIACVEARPMLWDHKHAYEDKTCRADAWKEIMPVVQSEQMPDVATVEKRWKLIRDRFARERKKMLTTDPPVEPKWYCWPSLAFLKDAVRSRKRRSMAQVAAMKVSEAVAAAQLPPQAPRQQHSRQQTPMKYFQVSFPEGGSQMKADLVSMEPATTADTSAVSSRSAAKRTKLDLRLPRHQLNSGRRTRHSAAPAAAIATTADDDAASAAVAQQLLPATISCLTSRLDSTASTADGLPSPSMLGHADDVVVAPSAVPHSTACQSLPSPSRILHSTNSVGGTATTTAGVPQESGFKGRSAFAVPLDVPARPRAGKHHVGDEPPPLAAPPQLSFTVGNGGGSMDGMDAEALFGAHVAATLRTLPRRHRARLQLNIEQCIVDMLSSGED